MATKSKAVEFKKGDRVRVLSGNWGANNEGTVAEVKSDGVSVKLDGMPSDHPAEGFGPLSVVKV